MRERGERGVREEVKVGYYLTMEDVIAARLYNQKDFSDLARYSSVPVINLLDDYGHPCQIMADFQTISEKKGLLLLFSFFSLSFLLFFFSYFFSSSLFLVPTMYIDLSKKIKISFFGDGQNNVTYELMRMCAIYGFGISPSPSSPPFLLSFSILLA